MIYNHFFMSSDLITRSSAVTERLHNYYYYYYSHRCKDYNHTVTEYFAKSVKVTQNDTND